MSSVTRVPSANRLNRQISSLNDVSHRVEALKRTLSRLTSNNNSNHEIETILGVNEKTVTNSQPQSRRTYTGIGAAAFSPGFLSGALGDVACLCGRFPF